MGYSFRVRFGFAVLSSRIPDNLPCAAVCRLLIIGALAAAFLFGGSWRTSLDGYSVWTVIRFSGKKKAAPYISANV
jgi:hypothetical protein